MPTGCLWHANAPMHAGTIAGKHTTTSIEMPKYRRPTKEQELPRFEIQRDRVVSEETRAVADAVAADWRDWDEDCEGVVEAIIAALDAYRDSPLPSEPSS